MEFLRDSTKAGQRKFPTGHRAAGAKVKLQTWAHPMQWAGHLRRAASQQRSWFGSYGQPHPWFCRGLRQTALSPSHSHTRGRGPGGLPGVQTGLSTPLHRSPRRSGSTDLWGAQSSGQERRERCLAWALGMLPSPLPPPPSDSLSL